MEAIHAHAMSQNSMFNLLLMSNEEMGSDSSMISCETGSIGALFYYSIRNDLICVTLDCIGGLSNSQTIQFVSIGEFAWTILGPVDSTADTSLPSPCHRGLIERLTSDTNSEWKSFLHEEAVLAG